MPLSESERKIMDALPCGLAVFHLVNPDDVGSYEMVYLNPASANHNSGKEPAMLLSKPLRSHFPELIESGHAATYKRVRDTKTAIKMPLLDYRGKGVEDFGISGVYSAEAFPINESLVGVMFINITLQVESEEQQIRFQKMEALARINAGVAHEIRNTLQVIKSMTTLMQERLHMALSTEESCHYTATSCAWITEKKVKFSAISEYAKFIDDSCSKTEVLLEQLLDFSRKKSTKLQMVNLEELVLKKSEILKKLLHPKSILSIESRDKNLVIESDPALLEQVIVNLLLNASDASKSNGNVLLKISRVSIEHLTRCVDKTIIPQGAYACIIVKDDGEGMSAETLEKIFDPFFTTKEMGTGLGLSSVHGIVKQLRGYIEVSTEPNAGSEFRILFKEVIL
ncbi:MAG: ATP-binding protein [Myxococcaceae bacterium]